MKQFTIYLSDENSEILDAFCKKEKRNFNSAINILLDPVFQKLKNPEPEKKPKKEKEIKIKTEPEIKPEKIKKEFIPPTLSDVISFFKEKEFPEELAKRAYEYYNTANWADSKGNKVLNWKQKMISVWLKPENKHLTPTLSPIINPVTKRIKHDSDFNRK